MVDVGVIWIGREEKKTFKNAMKMNILGVLCTNLSSHSVYGMLQFIEYDSGSKREGFIGYGSHVLAVVFCFYYRARGCTICHCFEVCIVVEYRFP